MQHASQSSDTSVLALIGRLEGAIDRAGKHLATLEADMTQVLRSTSPHATTLGSGGPVAAASCELAGTLAILAERAEGLEAKVSDMVVRLALARL